MKTVRDFDFTDKRVLVRCDLDIPMEDSEEGKVIQDDYRIRTALPTLKHILGSCRQLIIMGHIGRPKGEDESLSLKSIAEHTKEILDEDITLVSDYSSIPDDKVIMLENLRFHEGEMNNDEEFGKLLSSLGDIYVNEAFAVSHRKHASIVGVPKHIPGCIGFHFEQELRHLNINHPDRPFIGILGGAKMETKLPVIKEFLKKVDYLLLGGAMIFTFYKAQGKEIGKSLVQDEYIEEAKSLMGNEKLILPTDVVVADSTESESGEVVNIDSIPNDKMGLDLGPETVKKFKDIIDGAKTVVWNGPLGYEESRPFAEATKKIAEAVAGLRHAKTIIGGGDTAGILEEMHITTYFTHISTGGGASMILLEGKKLPAVKALED